MGDVIANQARGQERTWADNAAGNVVDAAFIVWLLQAAGTDDAWMDFDDLSALLGDGSFTEATFTSYARKTVSDGDISVTVDDTNNRTDIDVPDQTWTSAGNGTNNTLTDLDTGYDADTTAGTDADITPLSHHDFAVTTDGSDLTAQIASAGLIRLQ